MKRRSPLAGRAGAEVPEPDSEPAGPAERLAQAETVLLTRLRRRSLSVAEARASVEDLEEEAAEALIERFVELGYLDDARLADQVVHSHRDRKGLGRSGVEAEMRRRSIPPDVIQQSLGQAADDDEEGRAVEAACKRASQLTRYDEETIERRLTGFLMRKGYGSTIVRAAVRQALASVRPSGRPASGVRFR